MRIGTYPPRADILLAAGIGVLTVLEVVVSREIEPKPGALVAELVIISGIAFRRSTPILAAALASIGSIAEAAVGVPLNAPLVPLLGFVIIGYSLAVYAPMREAFIGGALLIGALAVEVRIGGGDAGNVVFGLVFLAAFAFMGATVRRRSAEAAEASRLAVLKERELADESRRAREEERARIAREIHDVVAHSLSVMIVQAGAAEQVVRADPERAIGPLQAIQQTGRAALGEMSALLGVLREGPEDIGLAPQPGIDTLPSLLEEARHAGLSVELEVTGTERDLPAGVGLTIYRVVQEALTNARKHGGPSTRVRVELAYLPDSVRVNVIDHGVGQQTEPRGGHGLIGMRERVEIYAGSLEAGPCPNGGYAVRMSIPALVPA
jgi:signal transduction histidine kinase